jgi:hypothetical protein
MQARSLSEYRRAEARHAPRRLSLYCGLAGVVAIVGCQLLLPRMPAQVIEFMRIAFRLDDLGGVVLFNDYAGIYFCAFFAGMFGLLGVVVGPREERQLELLLCKPVPAAEFLAARTWPVLISTMQVGAALAAACAAATLPYPGASVSAAGAFGAGLAMTAVVLLQMTALSVVFVRVSESMNAVLLALLVALAPMMPTAVFLYRPDLFVGHEDLAAVIVLANLVWYDATLVWLGPALLLVALAVAALGVRAGGRLLARADGI